MLHITLVYVGDIKTAWIKEGYTLYKNRITHMVKLKEHILKAENDPKKEQEKIEEYMEKTGDICIVLDERGTLKTSKEYAQWIEKKKDQGQSISIIIGGAYGLNDAIRKKADLVFSLSTLTFPHELAALINAEQLFRALSILAGTGYHHE